MAGATSRHRSASATSRHAQTCASQSSASTTRCKTALRKTPKIRIIAVGADQHQAVAAHLIASAGGEEAVAPVAVLGDPHAPLDHLDRRAARATQAQKAFVLELEQHGASVGPRRALQQLHL